MNNATIAQNARNAEVSALSPEAAISLIASAAAPVSLSGGMIASTGRSELYFYNGLMIRALSTSTVGRASAGSYRDRVGRGYSVRFEYNARRISRGDLIALMASAA